MSVAAAAAALAATTMLCATAAMPGTSRPSSRQIVSVLVFGRTFCGFSSKRLGPKEEGYCCDGYEHQHAHAYPPASIHLRIPADVSVRSLAAR